MTVSGHIRKRVGKNNNISYQIIIELPVNTNNGKRNRIYKTVNGTKKQAEKTMRTMMEELEGQTYVKENKLTVGEWTMKWFSMYLKNLSPTTLQGYEYQIKNYVLPDRIASIYIQDLTTSDVQKWINKLSEESPVSHKAMSGKSVKNIYHNLSAAMDKAVELDLVKKNVCKYVNLPKVTRYQAEVYDEKEIEKLILAAEGTDMELLIMIDVSLGLRRGELLGLKWKHIDFENKLVHIEENMVEVKSTVDSTRTITKAPKSQSGNRVIPISDSLCTYLKNAKKQYLEQMMKSGRLWSNEGYVICQPDGKPYKPASISKKFNKFLKDNNLKHIRLHDIRHTNATLMLKEGISPKVAQMRLGHSDFSTTMNIYSHVLKSVETSAAETIETFIFDKAKATVGNP